MLRKLQRKSSWNIRTVCLLYHDRLFRHLLLILRQPFRWAIFRVSKIQKFSYPYWCLLFYWRCNDDENSWFYFLLLRCRNPKSLAVINASLIKAIAIQKRAFTASNGVYGSKYMKTTESTTTTTRIRIKAISKATWSRLSFFFNLNLIVRRKIFSFSNSVFRNI